MGELVAVRGREQHAQLALQKSCRCRCGICSANLGRRLDLLEARVLSHWHEFLVHKSEVQRKFEDVFTKGLRPKGMAAAQHAELERRLGSFEAVVRHSEEAKEVDARHKLELQAFSEETWRGLERLQKRVAQESDSLGKASVDLQRGLAILDKKSDELQLSLQSQVSQLGGSGRFGSSVCFLCLPLPFALRWRICARRCRMGCSEPRRSSGQSSAPPWSDAFGKAVTRAKGSICRFLCLGKVTRKPWTPQRPLRTAP